jgi:hypothetical protein
MNDSQTAKAAADAKMSDIMTIKSSLLDGLYRLFRQRIHCNQADAKRFVTLPNVVKSLRSNILAQIQCIYSKCIPDKEWPATFTALEKKLKDAAPSLERTETMLDVARAAFTCRQKSVALACYNAAVASAGNIVPVLRVKIDVLDAMRQLADVNDESANVSANQRLTEAQMDG